MQSHRRTPEHFDRWLIGPALVMGLLVAAACETPPEMGEMAIPVGVTVISTEPISREGYSHCRLEGVEEAMIYASMPGRVVEVLVNEGDSVTVGDQLVKLDTDQQSTAGTSSALAAISAARANSENASANYERLQALYEAGAVSEQQLDGARAAAEAAQAQLNQAYAGYNQARSVRDNAVLEAPFSGRIGRVWARAGNMAGTGPLLSLANSSAIVAEALLPESDLPHLQVGLPAYVSVTAYGGESFPGVVTAVASSVDPVSGLVAVEVSFDDPEGKLMAGMTGRVSILLETVEEALLVEEIALRRTRTGYELALANGDRAEIVSVETGIRSRGLVEITSGIEPGDTVITRGQGRVAEGTLIEVEN